MERQCWWAGGRRYEVLDEVGDNSGGHVFDNPGAAGTQVPMAHELDGRALQLSVKVRDA